MTRGAGPIRNADGLEAGLKSLGSSAAILGDPPPTREGVEVHNIVTVGRLIARSALLRTESRGVHWRDDFPQREPLWDSVRTRVGRPTSPTD
jgi:L-aspartate oxidase